MRLPYAPIRSLGDVQQNFDALVKFLNGLGVTWRGVESPLRTIRGNVAANGSILAGTGFTVTKGTAGIYTINFSDTFSAAPSIVPNAELSAGVRRVEQDALPSTTSVGLRVRDSANALADGAFSFIVIGPA